MLDIEIFRVTREIKENGKVVGTVPLVSLGTYTPIPAKTQAHLSEAMKDLGEENKRSIKKVLVAIGAVDTLAGYAKILEGNMHPYARKIVSRQKRLLELSYPSLLPTRADGKPAQHSDFVEKRTNMLKSLQEQVSPMQLIGVMTEAVSEYHESVEMYAETRSFLGRGIAWSVDMLKHTPTLSPELKFLAVEGKHRPVFADMRQRA